MSFIENYLNKRNIGFQKTENGLFYTLEQEGSGDFPQSGQYVKIHYTGKFFDGKVFDSSHQRNESFIFQLGEGRVIPGWDQGIPLFRVGSKGSLYIPPELGYGEQGAGGVIPPNSSLIFDIEVLDIVSEAEYQQYMQAKREEYLKLLQEQQLEQLQQEARQIHQFCLQQGWDAQMTNHGLFYVIEREGSGPQPKAGQTIQVHYTGKLLDGQVFDSSYQRGQPFSFELGAGKVIQGWEEGLALFREGGKGQLVIPSLLGYGSQQVGPIPPNSILWFEVELVKVEA